MKPQRLNICCKLGKEVRSDMGKDAFFRFVKNRFTAGYILIYLFCALCVANTVGTLLNLLACACLSAVPVLVYVLVVRPNEGCAMPAAWQNYTLAILSYVCYSHIAIDLTDRRMADGSMREKIASMLLHYAFIVFLGNLVRALLTVHGDLYLDNPLFWVLFALGAIVAAAIARHDYLKEHGGYPR